MGTSVYSFRGRLLYLVKEALPIVMSWFTLEISARWEVYWPLLL